MKNLLFILTMLGIVGCSNNKVTIPSDSSVEVISKKAGDQGNGYYRNPIIMAGDIADVGLMRVDKDYYLVHYYTAAPGHLMWHSRDLVNWEPIGNMWSGKGGGGDISKYGDLFYYYQDYRNGSENGISVRTAPNPLGPWSVPTKLEGMRHDVTVGSGPDGRRWAIAGFGTGIIKELTKDGKSYLNISESKYKGWDIPSDWDIECNCLEGWNTFYKDGYYYITAAQGGTSGPPTSHMVIAARSKSMEGPWENSPHNPILHTSSADEPFWSQGNGRLIDTPDGDWYMMYHTYLKDRINLGRQINLAPIEWTEDGWFKIPENTDLAGPLKKPKGEAVAHGFKLTDDFKGPELDLKWGFPAQTAEGRYRFADGGMYLKGNGESVKECVPMVMPVTHTDYEYIVEMTVPEGVIGGATIYYEKSVGYAALGLKDGLVQTYMGFPNGHNIGFKAPFDRNHIFIKMQFEDDLVRMFYSADGKDWTKVTATREASGLTRNALGPWEGLRPGIFACGNGEVLIQNFELKPLP
ncbi:family 43 glycosylhydrolase [Algibacter amylolyticus]|nr:family 43 glycosylhydrolase [Algibacter amylolyticus]MBB5268746.1 beta-xylosidase [Algibacter amylolyticus]